MADFKSRKESSHEGRDAVRALGYQRAYRPYDMLWVCSGALCWERSEAMLINSERFGWWHCYNSEWRERPGPLGPGFRHRFENELELEGRRLRFTEFDGSQVEFTFDAEDGVQQKRHSYLLHRKSNTEFSVYSCKQRTAYFYSREEGQDSSFRLEFLLSPYRERVEFRYDAQGRVCEILAEDCETSFLLDYNEQGRLVELSKAVGSAKPRRLLSYRYDEQGQLCEYLNPYEGRTSFRLQAGLLVEERDPMDYRFVWSYDEQGRCIACVSEDGLSSFDASYHGHETRVRYGDGGEWIYRHNEDQVIVEIEDPRGGIVAFECAENGVIREERDPAGRVRMWLYDDDGEHTGRVDRFGAHLSTAQDSLNPSSGRELRPPTNLAKASYWEFLQGSEHPRRHIGRIVARVPPGLHAVLAKTIHELLEKPRAGRPLYDVAGNCVRRINGYGQVWKRSYSKRGNCIYTLCPTGTDGHYRYTSWGLETEVEGASGAIRRYQYAPGPDRAQRVGVTDEIGMQTRYVRDRCGAVCEIYRDEELEVRYEHDLAGRVVRTFDGEGQLLVRYEFDDERESERRIQCTGEIHSYERDEAGMYSRASVQGHDLRLKHDDERRVIFDMRNARGIEVLYDHQEETRVLRIFELFSIRYQEDGDTIRIRTPEGSLCVIERLTESSVLRRHGDDLQELSHFDQCGVCTGRMLWSSNEGCESIWNAHYRYSKCRQLLEIDDSEIGRASLDYDLEHRLVAMKVRGGEVMHCDYDKAGNLLANEHYQEMRVDRRSRLLQADEDRFVYDRRGNLAEHRSSRGRKAFCYNAINRLVRVDFDDSREAWQACYDGLGRLIWSQVGTARTQYYWQGSRVIARVNPQGELRVFVYAVEEAMVPIMFVDYESPNAVEESGRLFKVISDQAGMPRLILDADDEICWSVQKVCPYGEIEVEDPMQLDYELRWPGQIWHPHVEICTSRFRTYVPRLGRYLQANPSGYAGTDNMYAYSGNPLADLDVLGF